MNPIFRLSLFAVIAVLTLTAASYAVTNYYWDVTTGSYNTKANWNPDYPSTATTDDYMFINNGGTAQITANTMDSPYYLHVGSGTELGAPTTGTVTHSAGTLTLVGEGTGAGSLRVGHLGGVGTYNMTGGTITATWSTGGNTVGVYVGYDADTAPPGLYGNGTFKMSNAATATFTGQARVGYAQGTGVVELRNTSKLSTGNVYFGNGSGGNGTLTMYDNADFSGGTTYFANTAGAVANVTLNGSSTLRLGNTYFAYADGAGEIGNLTMNDSSSMTTGSLAFAYDGTSGNTSSTVVMNGTSTISSGTLYIARAGGNATVTMNGSSRINATGTLYVGVNSGGSTGFLNVGDGTGSAVVNASGTVSIGQSSAIGTLNLNTNSLLSAAKITLSTSGGTATLNVDGGTIRAVANANEFIYNGGGTSAAYIKAGGATIDTNDYNAVVKSALLTHGTSTGGGLTKTGRGQLVLASDANTYTGATMLNAGSLLGYGTLSPITMAAGTSLTAAKWDTAGNAIDTSITGAVNLATSTLTVANNDTLNFVVTGDGLTSLTAGTVAVAGGGSTTVGVDFTGLAPTVGGPSTLINYTAKTGTPVFKTVVDSYGTVAADLTDNGTSTVSVTFDNINSWITGSLDCNFSTPGNWSSGTPNGTDKRALFAGTGETVNLDMDATLSSMTFDGSGYTLAPTGANKLTMDSSIALNAQINNITGSNAVTAAVDLNRDTRVTVAQSADTLTLSGVVGGAGGINKVGAGTLVLSNAGNSLSGPITVGAGTLEAASLASGSGVAGDLTVGDGTLRYTGPSATLSRGLTTSGAATIQVNTTGATLKLTGPVASPNSNAITETLAKTGAGTLELTSPSATNRIADALTVYEGGLALGTTAGTAQYDVGGNVTVGGTVPGGTTGSTAGLTLGNGAHLVASGYGYFGATAGSIGSLTMSGDSSAVFGSTVRFGQSTATAGNDLTMSGSASLTTGSHLYFGYTGTAGDTTSNAVMNDNATIAVTGNGYVGRTGSTGTLTMNNSSQLSTTAIMYVGVSSNSTSGGNGTMRMYGDEDPLTTDSNLTVGTHLTVGYSSGTGLLEMYNHTSATAGYLRVANSNSTAATAPTTMGTFRLHDYSTLVATGDTSTIGLYAAANGLLEMDGHATASFARFEISNSNYSGTDILTATTGTVNLRDYASVAASGYTVVGLWRNSEGHLNLYDDSSLTVASAADFVSGDSGGALAGGGVGYVTINDRAVVNVLSTDNTYGFRIGNNTGGTGTVTVGDGDSGDTATLNSSCLINVGASGTGTLIINRGGTVVAPRIRLGEWTGSVGALYFNGGTFRATASRTDFIYTSAGTASAYIQSGGAVIDTNGYDVVIRVPLLEDTFSAGGGLTKIGGGRLALADGGNTYTGPTLINEGSLLAYGTLGPITMANGTTLMPGKWDITNKVIDTTTAGYVSINTSSLTLADSANLRLAMCQPELLGGGITYVSTGALVASSGNSTVLVDYYGSNPVAGSFPIINYTSKTGNFTFLTPYDSYGTLGLDINDTGFAINGDFAEISNHWTSGGLDANYSDSANWSSYVPNAGNHRALFDGAGETVGLDMNATVTSLIFNGSGFDLSPVLGSTLTLDSTIATHVQISNVSGNNTVSAPIVLAKDARVTVSQDVDALTLSGVISGNGLEKQGAGTLVLSNGSNSFSGPLNVAAGTLQATSAGALGAGTGAASDLLVAGTLHYTGATGSTNRGLTTTGAATVQVDSAAATLTVAGAMATSGGSLNKMGAGTLELKSPVAANTLGSTLSIYDGAVLVNSVSGTTQYDVTDSLYIGTPNGTGDGTNGTLTMGGDAVLNVTTYTECATYGGTAVITLNDNAVLKSSYGRIGGSTLSSTLVRPSAVITLNNNAKIDFANFCNVGEANADANLTLNNSSVVDVGSIDFGWGANTNAVGTMNGSSSLVVTANKNGSGSSGYLNIGRSGENATGSLTMNGTSTVTCGRIYAGYSGKNASGTLTMNTGTTLNCTSMYIGYSGDATGRATGALTVADGASLTCTGAADFGRSNANTTVDIAGTVRTGNANFGYTNGNATVTISGSGSFTSTGSIAVANSSNSTSTLTMTGSASMTAASSWIAIGNAWLGGGSAQAWMSDTATMSCGGELQIGWGGTGTLHIGDGTPTDNVVVHSDTNVCLGWGTSLADTHATINLNAGGTLETPYIYTGYDQGTAGTLESILNFNGGTLRSLANDTPAIPFISNTGGPASNAPDINGGSLSFQLNVMAGGAVIDTNGFDDTITLALVEATGSTGGGLTKLGDGKLSLTSDAHTYSGDTLVLDGTLSTTDSAMMDDDSSLWIALDAVMDLNFTGSDTIGRLYLDGVAQATGTWGSTASGAAHINDTYFTGTGTVLVTVNPVFIPGDTNGDMVVDDDDAAVVANHWGQQVAQGDYASGDFNNDGLVNAADAAIQVANWGSHTESNVGVPEPSMFILLLGFGLAALVRRGRV